MTIRKLRVAAGDRRGAMAAARYPLDADDSPEAFAPPPPDGKAPRPAATWIGTQEALGEIGLELGEQVQAEDLAQALLGRHVRTGDQVRRPGSVKRVDEHGEEYREKVVNSYDLTFSVPKSVSVLWSLPDPELRAELERAVRSAAEKAVAYVTRTRAVVSGKETAQGFAASSALHVTARIAEGEEAPSPQLHVHTHLLGVLDEKGDLRTPHSAALYQDDAMREAGSLARAILAKELEALGFSIEALTGKDGRYFEVAGVDEGLCERMSGRTKDVEKEVSSRETDLERELTSRERSRVATLTRREKIALGAARSQRAWNDHHAEFEFGVANLPELRGGPRPERIVGALQEVTRREILRRVWTEGPTVSDGAIRAMAFDLTPTGLTFEQVFDVIAEMQERGELIALEHGRVTTRMIRERERYVLGVALRSVRQPGEVLSEAAVETGRRKAEETLGKPLGRDQYHALQRLSKGAGWACLTGQAGTGKGPVLEALAEAYRANGWQVLGAAVDGATTRRLGKQMGSEASTIDSLLGQVERDEVWLDERTVIVIEEATKVGLAHWTALAQLCEATGARMRIVGGRRQIRAVECPGLFDVLLEHEEMHNAWLTQVHRHRDPDNPDEIHRWLRDYQTALYDGDSREAIRILRSENAITTYGSREDAMEGLVDRWAQRRQDEDIAVDDAILVVYGSNRDIDHVNELAQGRRLQDRELGSDSVKASDRDYELYAGDVVMLREAAYHPPPEPGALARKIENGTTGIVEQVDRERERVWVRFDEPDGARTVPVDLGDLREWRERASRHEEEERIPALRLNYAAHPFPLLGATYDYVGSLWGHWSQGGEDAYGGDARSRFWLDVHLGFGFDTSKMTEQDLHQLMAEQLRRHPERVASITLAEARDVRVAPRAADLPVVPEITPYVPLWRETSLPDPADRFEVVLGPERTARIRHLADQHEEELAALEEEELTAERDHGQLALSALDGAGALEARRLERDRAVFAEHGEDAALAGVIAREEDLVAAGLHPDQWVWDYGDAFARGIAAERQLAVREVARDEIELGPDFGIAPDVDLGPEMDF